MKELLYLLGRETRKMLLLSHEKNKGQQKPALVRRELLFSFSRLETLSLAFSHRSPLRDYQLLSGCDTAMMKQEESPLL